MSAIKQVEQHKPESGDPLELAPRGVAGKHPGDLVEKIITLFHDLKEHTVSYFAERTRAVYTDVRAKLATLEGQGLIHKRIIVFGGRSLELFSLAQPTR